MANIIATAQIAPFRSFEEATDALRDTAHRGGVAHLSYWFLQYDGDDVADMFWVSTYEPQYMTEYMAYCTPTGDPVMQLLHSGESMVEWVHQGLTETECELLLRAERRGISNLGFSLGRRPSADTLIAFSVNAPLGAKMWSAEKQVIAERFRVFSREFHQRIRPLVYARQQGLLSMTM
jgi:Autoinducer binding domain